MLITHPFRLAGLIAFCAAALTSLHAQAPVIAARSTETIVSGNPYSYTVSATGSPTSYSVEGLPAGLTLDAATGIIRGVCGYNTGTYTATLSATNASGTGSATQTFVVQGGGPIEMPYVRAITPPAAGSYQVGDVLLFRVQFANGYSFPYVTGRPRIALTINGQPRSAQYAWGSGDEYHLYTYTVAATDAGAQGIAIGNTIDLNGGAIEDSRPLTAALNLPAAEASAVRLDSGAPNAAPVLHLPTYAVAQIGRAFSFQIVGTQAPSSYTAVGLPAGLTLDAATGVISGTPTLSGNFRVTVSASNAFGANTQALELNIPHTIATITPPARGVYRAGQQLSFQVVFSTPVTISGSPTLPIQLDSSAVNASYMGGSGTTHTFTYTLQASDLDRDGALILGPALALNVARVADSATGAYVHTKIPADQQTIRDIAVTDGSSSEPSLTWGYGDIGSDTLAGSNASAGTTLTIQGAGRDIWDGADGFRFVYRALTGDGTVEAQVVSLSATNPWTKAGVMIRESLEAGSRNVFLCMTPSNGILAQSRRDTGSTTDLVSGPWTASPYWVRLVRSGARIVAYTSPDASAWTEVAAFDVTLGATAYFGFAVTSHEPSQLATATFSEPFVQ